jgi:hypothetical protein
MTKPTLRYNREFACYEVIIAGRVVYQTIDLYDAREYVALFA